MSLELNFTFDDKTYRHFLNGQPVVMHSHHYLALVTQMVEGLADIDGPQILADTVEDTMRAIFEDYFQKHGATSTQEKGNICTQYYSAFGLGKMAISGNEHGGEVKLSRSHIDEGWIKKWGEHEKPVNHFTRGYVAGMFAAIFDRPPRSFSVTEAVGMVTGEDQSVFVVKAA